MPSSWEATMVVPALTVAVVACLGYLLIWALAVAIRIRRPRRPRPRLALLSLLGLAVSAAGPAVAGEKSRSSARRLPRISPAPPWSDPDGFPPPHPSGRTGVLSPPFRSDRELPGSTPRAERSGHATVRRGASPATSGREVARRGDSSERAAADTGSPGTHEVRAGDSLWTIAARWLDTDDAARIARYWPRVHRANRSTVGADPNLIHPGQILRMPPEPGRGSRR